MSNAKVTKTAEGGRRIVINIEPERVAIILHSNRSFTDLATNVVAGIDASNVGVVVTDATAAYRAEFAAGNVDGTLTGEGRQGDLVAWFMGRPEYESVIAREAKIAREAEEAAALAATEAAQVAAEKQELLNAAAAIVAEAEALLEQ